MKLRAHIIWIGVLWLCATGASAELAVRRPRLSGPSHAVGVAREAVSAENGRRSPEQWARVAWEALRNEGWLWARVRSSARGDSLELDPGQLARYTSLDVQGADSLMARLFLEGAGLSPGRVYRPGRWEALSLRGLRLLADRGYPFASVSLMAIESDLDAATVALRLWLSTGKQATIGTIHIEGARHTQPEILRRMSGLRAGELYRESSLDRARQRLLARDVVAEVLDIAPQRSAPDGSEVDIRIHLLQPRSTGRVAAALGLVQDPNDKGTRLSGSVDLVLLDLLGTARQLHGHFLDDGANRRRLDVSYVEPMILGSPLDLRGAVGQRHEDELYDTVLGELALRLPWRGDQSLELGAGVDRTSFVGDEGRLRIRTRLNAAVGLQGRRGTGSGLFGELHTRVQAARVRESFNQPIEGGATARTESQTLLDASGRLGWAFQRWVALVGRVAWQSVSSDDLPLPVSEQWYIGGATTIRGYREDQFRGEQVGYGGMELVLGAPRGGQGYVFYDLGWRRESFLDDDLLRSREDWLSGFGLGIRSPAAFGRLDLSVGFADELSFEAGKIHLALIQEF